MASRQFETHPAQDSQVGGAGGHVDLSGEVSGKASRGRRPRAPCSPAAAFESSANRQAPAATQHRNT
jgi:hypothetical protein